MTVQANQDCKPCKTCGFNPGSQSGSQIKIIVANPVGVWYYFFKYYFFTGNHRARAALPSISEGQPSRRKEGTPITWAMLMITYYRNRFANPVIKGIFGSDSDRYLHCSADRFVLYNLSGQKIAATTSTSDGCWIVKSV